MWENSLSAWLFLLIRLFSRKTRSHLCCKKETLIDLQFLTDLSNRSFFIFIFKWLTSSSFPSVPAPHFLSSSLSSVFLVLIFFVSIIISDDERRLFSSPRSCRFFRWSLCSCFVQTNLNTLEADMMGCKCCD